MHQTRDGRGSILKVREQPASDDAIPVLTGVKGASLSSAPSGFGL
jgi:hypothetical protein